ncbi:hypothetical protein Tco_0351528 [Tanacetum coccineum]
MAKSQDGKELSCDDPQNAQEHNDKYKFKEQAQPINQRSLQHIHKRNILQLAIDGVGFDWSFRQRWQIPTTFLLCISQIQRKRFLILMNQKLNALKIEIKRTLIKKKESNQIKIDNFENASKSLDKLIGCQISDNNRKGVGYNVVAPPPTGLFAPPSIDFSNSGLEEFKQPEFKGYGVKVNKSVSENSSKEIKKPRERSNFAPTAVLTKSGLVPISTARQSSSRAAAPVSTARPIKTAAPKPFVNVVKSRPNAFQKSHSPSRRSFYQHTTLKNRNLNNRVNTVKGRIMLIDEGLGVMTGRRERLWGKKRQWEERIPTIPLNGSVPQLPSYRYTKWWDADAHAPKKPARSNNAEALKTKIPTKIDLEQKKWEETEYEDVETEHAEEVEYGDILQQITPSKGPQGEEQSQESSEVHFDVLSAAKILADAS